MFTPYGHVYKKPQKERLSVNKSPAVWKMLWNREWIYWEHDLVWQRYVSPGLHFLWIFIVIFYLGNTFKSYTFAETNGS